MLSEMLAGSESFRLAVCTSLLRKKNKNVLKEFQKEIKNKFPSHASTQRVEAIKFIRDYEKSPELNLALKEKGKMSGGTFSLEEAKKFVESF